MLERATACFESAGRRLFRDPNDAIRTRRLLCRDFWKHNTAGEDLPNWFLALVHSNQRPSSALNLTSQNQTQSESAHEEGTPFLEFLYPKSSSPGLRISRQSRKLGLRRRRRSLVGFSRTYASEAVSTTQTLLPDTPRTYGTHFHSASEQPVPQAVSELSGILERRGKDFDKAWVLYLTAGRPLAVRSALCEYLANSKKSSDWDRAWEVFEQIPLQDRSPSDFYHISRSQVRQENVTRLIQIARLAKTYELADKSIPWIFAYFWTRQMWTSAVEVWGIASHLEKSADKPTSQLLFSRITDTSLLWKGLEFGKYLLEFPDQRNQTMVGLGQMFLKTISQSPVQPEHAPLDALLEILRLYRKLGISMEPYYYSIIDTLQHSSSQSGFSRSIVFYRQLRWQYPKNRPPYKLIERQMVAMNSWNMADGIIFFLDELALLHEKPGMAAYLATLDCLAHAGNVSHIESVFNRMKSDRGPPSDCRSALPLLYVHAETGNVAETYRQFERLSNEFDLQPNTHCWNVLIKAHATQNDWTGAREAFAQMLHAGLRPDSYTFGTLMGIAANRGDIDSTRQLLRESQQYQVAITMPMLDTIILVYCKNGHLDLAEQLAEACVNLQIGGSHTRMWNTILYQHARRLDVKSCRRIQERMKSVGVPADAWTTSATMLGLVLAGRPHKARRILKKMHQNRSFYAKEYHYSLVLFGYLEQGNRDMVHIIFREIVERFGKAGPRSSLLYLKSQVQRDLQIAKEAQITSGPGLHLVHAEKALNQFVASSHATSSIPTPDDHPIDDTAAILQYGYLIKEYGTRGAIDRARALYQQFLDNRVAPGSRNDQLESVPIEVLSSMMEAHLHAAEYQKAGELWTLALSDAMNKATRLDFSTFTDPRPATPEASSTESSTHRASRRGSSRSQTSAPFSADTSVLENGLLILPAQRFILAKPLSLYMRALVYQNEISKIGEVVADLEKLGFALTTFNWTTWVQMLASSEHYSDQLKGFRIFEEKFAPHFPGWYKLLRGFGRKSPEMTSTIWMLEDPRTESFRQISGKKARKYWINIEPDLLQPTYLTIAFLAASLDRIRGRTLTQGDVELQKISAAAPQTVKLIGEMPYKRDKLQGVLIRHRSQQADKEKSPIEHLVTRSGILGTNGQTRRRPDLFLNDESLETWQPKFPHDLFEKEGEFNLTEDSFQVLPDTSFSEGLDAMSPVNPMSPADQMDIESHLRRSANKQKRQHNLQFARVIAREKKRNEISKQQGGTRYHQPLANGQPLGKEDQVSEEAQMTNQVPEPENHQDLSHDVQKLEAESESANLVTETSGKTPDEGKSS